MWVQTTSSPTLVQGLNKIACCVHARVSASPRACCGPPGTVPCVEGGAVEALLTLVSRVPSRGRDSSRANLFCGKRHLDAEQQHTQQNTHARSNPTFARTCSRSTVGQLRLGKQRRHTQPTVCKHRLAAPDQMHTHLFTAHLKTPVQVLRLRLRLVSVPAHLRLRQHRRAATHSLRGSEKHFTCRTETFKHTAAYLLRV